MDILKKNQTTLNKSTGKNNGRNTETHVGEAAGELLNEGKKLANEIYEEGLYKVSEAWSCPYKTGPLSLLRHT